MRLHSDHEHFVRSLSLALVAVVLILGLAVAASENSWEKRVPEADRARSNPQANDPGAISNGAKVYTAKCAKCHGENAEGKGHHPSLRTAEAQQATPGELEWIIQHGSRFRMPGFGSLPDSERWQLVSYIKSLGTETK